MSIEHKNLIHQPEELLDLPRLADSTAVYKTQRLDSDRIATIKGNLIEEFCAVSTDLSTNNLAGRYVTSLVDKLVADGAQTESELIEGGSREFFGVSRTLLGPLWASYVDTVFRSGSGGETYLFAARDATPMYHAAQGLLRVPSRYDLKGSKLVHVDWNRWFMGQEDETDSDRNSLPLTHPHMKQFYEQMGFGNGNLIKIVEPGAWGSAANALKQRMPDQAFELWFMFSHMPDRIYGFLNDMAPNQDPKTFEMINDTAEAVPKPYVRPETFVEEGGFVLPNIRGKVTSVYMQAWTKATQMGSYAAGVDFSLGTKVDIPSHICQLHALSDRAKQGEWTGILPGNSLTWTEGEKWKSDWKWGKIPPLK